MKFRLKAFGLHLTASVAALSLVLVALFLGWYRWPGWYLTSVLKVVTIMVGVDVALGPLLTFVIANPRKPRRELALDIAAIVTVQLIALVYGAATLWHGRPLYYTFSADRLEIVQASALRPAEIELARQQKPEFAPYWYSLPRWVWAPLPEDEETRNKIMTMAITEGQDVIDMPRYFKPWAEGLPALRQKLKTVNDQFIFSRGEKAVLKARMTERGLTPEQPDTLFMMGSDARLLAVFDPATLKIKAILAPR